MTRRARPIYRTSHPHRTPGDTWASRRRRRTGHRPGCRRPRSPCSGRLRPSRSAWRRPRPRRPTAPRQPRPVATYVIAAGSRRDVAGRRGAGRDDRHPPPAAASGGYVANVSVPGRVLTSFGDGAWQIGVDVEPGTYTTTSVAARPATMRSRAPGPAEDRRAAQRPHRRADGGGRLVGHLRMPHLDAHRLTAHPGGASTFTPPRSRRTRRARPGRRATAPTARSPARPPLDGAQRAVTAPLVQTGVDGLPQRRPLSAVEGQRSGRHLVVVVVQLVLPQVVVPEPACGAGRVAETAGDGVVDVGHGEHRGTGHRQFREDAAVADRETWTAEECAAAWGVKTPTWLGYVSRAQAPPALPQRDAGGRRLWDADGGPPLPPPGSGRSRAGASDAAGGCWRDARGGRAARRAAPAAGAAPGGQGAGPGDRADGGGAGISRQTAYSWLGIGR